MDGESLLSLVEQPLDDFSERPAGLLLQQFVFLRGLWPFCLQFLVKLLLAQAFDQLFTSLHQDVDLLDLFLPF